MKKMIKRILTLCALVFTTTSALTACGNADGYFEMKENNVSMIQYEEHQIECEYHNLTPEDVVWKSSANDVVTVYNGLITSVGIGRATITGSYGSDSYVCNVLVTKSTVGRALVLSDTLITLDFGLGEEKDVSAELKENGVTKEANIVWESSDPSIITVSDKGHIKPVSRGTAVVAAFCIYKGQKFKKSIIVKSVSLSATPVTLSLLDDTHTGTSLTPHDDSSTMYFDNPKESYKYVSNGGYESRVFAKDLFKDGKPINDRFVFQVKFEDALTFGSHLSLGNKNKALIGNESLLTDDSAFLFYDYKGRIANYLRVSKNYYVVANLNKATSGNDFGFYFDSPITTYLSTGFVCSDDYLFEQMGFEKPTELPPLNFMVADTGSGLTLGDQQLDWCDKYWVMNMNGTDVWNDDMWNNRVTIGGVDYSTYRLYNYEYMDIMFTDPNFVQMLIWTGGYSIRLDKDGNMSSTETLSFQNDDLTVYKDGRIVPQGTPFEANVVYTFKIRIQKDNLENIAFGINFLGKSKGDIYLANPTFKLI